MRGGGLSLYCISLYFICRAAPWQPLIWEDPAGADGFTGAARPYMLSCCNTDTLAWSGDKMLCLCHIFSAWAVLRGWVGWGVGADSWDHRVVWRFNLRFRDQRWGIFFFFFFCCKSSISLSGCSTPLWLKTKSRRFVSCLLLNPQKLCNIVSI